MNFIKLDETAKEPTKKYPKDAGYDLYSLEDGVVQFGQFKIFKTGIAGKFPENHFGFITNKSSKNYLIGGGIVDEGYEGELLVKVMNPLKEAVHIHKGDAIAQLLVIPIHYDSEVQVLSKESRSVDGGISRQAVKRARATTP